MSASRKAALESQNVAAGRGEPGRGGVIDKKSPPHVVKKRRRLTVEIGDGQVDRAVAVGVATSHAHSRLVASAGAGGDARGVPDFLEVKATQVVEQKVGGAVVGDEQVGEAVAVEISGHDAQATAFPVVDARFSLVTSTNRP